MINYFWIEIKGKNPKRFLSKLLKLKINIADIKYEKDKILLKVSYEDYKNIKQIKTIYTIKIIKTSGKKKLLEQVIKYKIPLLTFIISVFFLLIISNFILFINIDTENKNIKKIIKENLQENNVTLYSKKKSYTKLKEITQNIKNNNLDNIEWIEIDQKGVVLTVKVIERLSNNTNTNNNYKDIVASKNGYIKKIYSRKGEVLKNIDDYVKKGDIIISGNIFRNDKVVDRVKANGKVYAEVWYIVKLNDKLIHQEITPKEVGKQKLILKVNKKEITFLTIPKKVITENKKNFFKNDIFSLYLKQEKNYQKETTKYKENDLTDILNKRAKNAINKNLKKDEYIIKQKTLKKYIKNGKMYIEVFFKTYEDISLEKDSVKIEEKVEEE
mgnify:FL=1